MKTDLHAALDVTVTFLNALTWLWLTAPIILTALVYALAAMALVAIGRRIRDSFHRANQTIADIQQPTADQPRKETPQS